MAIADQVVLKPPDLDLDKHFYIVFNTKTIGKLCSNDDQNRETFSFVLKRLNQLGCVSIGLHGKSTFLKNSENDSVALKFSRNYNFKGF